MAINKGIIQVRRGLKEDLQSDKLLPGELAIATDAPCMWFCWSPGNVEQLPTSDNVIDVIIETVNQYLANNDITVISDGFMRVYDGWIQYSADNKTWKNVIAVSELIGENGGYYTPAVTDNGDLTWTPSSAGMEPLPSVNIRGPEAELTKESVENALGYAPLKSADVVDNLLGNSGDLPLSAKQGNVLDEKISELNTSMEWKKAGSSYNTNSISVPSTAKEVKVMVIVKLTNTTVPLVFDFSYINEFPLNSQQFRTVGYYYGSNDWASIGIGTSVNGVLLQNSWTKLKYSGTEYTLSSVASYSIHVYYR